MTQEIFSQKPIQKGMILVRLEELEKLKKKAKIADDIVLQLEMSLKDAEAGRIKRVA